MQWQNLFNRKTDDQHIDLVNLAETDRLPAGRNRHTLAIRLGVGHWIRQKLLDRSGSGQLPSDQPRENTATDPVYDESKFGTVLAVLEYLEDFTTLGDLLLFHAKSHEPQLLTAIAVTINHYLDIFLACGTADTIFIQLMQQRTMLNSKPGYLTVVEALIDLAERLPDRSRETRMLRKERQKHESKSLVAACSPISEHMAEALQMEHSGSSLLCTDDIEQLLASGTSMDKQLLADVFGLIWRRFEIASAESVGSAFTAAGLLNRLRPFDATTVTQMTISRVDEFLASGSRVARHSMWISLVCARIISLEKLLDRILQALQQMDDASIRNEVFAGIAECLTLGRPRANTSISHVCCEIVLMTDIILTYFVALLPVLCTTAVSLTGFVALNRVSTKAYARTCSQRPGRFTPEYSQAPEGACTHSPTAKTPPLEPARQGCIQRNLQARPHDRRSSGDASQIVIATSYR